MPEKIIRIDLKNKTIKEIAAIINAVKRVLERQGKRLVIREKF